MISAIGSRARQAAGEHVDARKRVLCDTNRFLWHGSGKESGCSWFLVLFQAIDF
jgi:hypothetical protein